MLKVPNILEEGRWGGPQKRVVSVAKALISRDVNTIVVCPAENSEILVSGLMRNNTVFHKIPLRRLTKDKKHLLKYTIRLFSEISLHGVTVFSLSAGYESRLVKTHN